MDRKWPNAWARSEPTIELGAQVVYWWWGRHCATALQYLFTSLWLYEGWGLERPELVRSWTREIKRRRAEGRGTRVKAPDFVIGASPPLLLRLLWVSNFVRMIATFALPSSWGRWRELGLIQYHFVVALVGVAEWGGVGVVNNFVHLASTTLPQAREVHGEEVNEMRRDAPPSHFPQIFHITKHILGASRHSLKLLGACSLGGYPDLLGDVCIIECFGWEAEKIAVTQNLQLFILVTYIARTERITCVGTPCESEFRSKTTLHNCVGSQWDSLIHLGIWPGRRLLFHKKQSLASCR